jgi:hypothetical protein
MIQKRITPFVATLLSFGLSLGLALVVGLALSAPARSAPMPGASLSNAVAPRLGVFRSTLGFEIGAAIAGWTQGDPPEGNRYIQTIYRGPASADGQGSPPMLTVRADKLERPVSLDRYVQKWQREYPKYGFDVIGAKSFAQGQARGYVLDLMNRTGQKQLRQVVFLKKKTAVILTCRDQIATFKESLKGCNQIIKSFRWLE